MRLMGPLLVWKQVPDREVPIHCVARIPVGHAGIPVYVHDLCFPLEPIIKIDTWIDLRERYRG